MKQDPRAYDEDIALIARYALRLYSRSQGVVRNSGRVVYAGQDPDTGGHVICLRAQKHDQIIQRNISIACLGDGSGSKSKCMLLVYDRPIVIKLPPSPPADFTAYLEALNSESHIAERLGPDTAPLTSGIAPILMNVRKLTGQDLVPRQPVSPVIARRDIPAIFNHLVHQELLRPLANPPDSALFVRNLFFGRSKQILDGLKIDPQMRIRLQRAFMAQLEMRYREIAREDPAIQHYLKVNGRFAFFMDLLETPFISTFINQLQPSGKTLNRQLEKEPVHLTSRQAFGKVYPQTKVFQSYDILTRQMADFKDVIIGHLPVLNQKRASRDPILLSEAQLDLWAVYLVLDYPIPRLLDFPPELYDELSRFQTRIRNDKALQELFGPYKRVFRDNIARLTAKSHFRIMEELITRILDLFQQLWTQKIAIRDLKPGNLFITLPGAEKLTDIAGKPFHVGLIDFETAVIHQQDRSGGTAQPILGGSPHYATPSHFFLNPFLENQYGDLSKVFFFQDLYAVTALVFEVATGKKLFKSAAKTIGGLLQTLREADSHRPSDLQMVYRQYSRRFWQNAKTDLVRRVKRHRRRLRAIRVNVPAQIGRELKAYAQLEKAHLQREYQNLEQELKKGARISGATAAQGKPPEIRNTGTASTGNLQARLRHLDSRLKALDKLLLHLSTEAETIVLFDLLPLLFGASLHFMQLSPKP